MQQNLPIDEQAPYAFTAAQDVIEPFVILDSSVPDTSAQGVPPLEPLPLLLLPLPEPELEPELEPEPEPELEQTCWLI